MGNCCKASSSMEWDGEDWSSLKSNNITTTKRSSNKVFDQSHQDNGLCLGKVQKEKLLQKANYPDGNGKLKLRISKKELAEILLESGGGGGGGSAEEVLLRLINSANNANKRHGHWKPMLDCIPESPKLS